MGAHVGRTNAPHSSNAGGCQKCNGGFRNIGQIRGHTVARLDALRLQVQSQRRNLAAQLRPRNFTVLAYFVFADHRHEARRLGRLDVTKDLLRVIDLRTHKPLRARHDVFHQGRLVWRGRLELEVVPNALPKRIQLGGGPAPQGVIRIKVQAPLVTQPVLIQTNLRNKSRLGHCPRVSARARGLLEDVPDLTQG